MQFELPFRSASAHVPDQTWLQVGQRKIQLRVVSNRRARRYILRLRNDGTARVTVPRRGSAREAVRFAQKNVGWLEKQLLRQAHAVNQTHAWILQTEILFRGESARLELGTNGETGLVRFGTEVLRVKDPAGDLRPEIEQHLRKLAIKELPFRTLQLAEAWGVPIRRVTVRNQRSRWGSCSRHGTISLNWRLIQTPLLVRDYIILHELAHVKEMSHSARFWSEVERLCPNYAEAERWIKRHSSLLQ